jgi:NADH:ubiquinone oxidoreductase subunit 6 (subunit J)
MLPASVLNIATAAAVLYFDSDPMLYFSARRGHRVAAVIAQRNPKNSVLLLITSLARSGSTSCRRAPAAIQIISTRAPSWCSSSSCHAPQCPHEDTDFDERTHPMLRPGPMRFGALLAVALIAELAWALARSSPLTTFTNTPVTSVQALGRTLFTDYAFQFEVTSVLILVAMVGAVVMARREDAPGGKR